MKHQHEWTYYGGGQAGPRWRLCTCMRIEVQRGKRFVESGRRARSEFRQLAHESVDR